MAVQKLFPGTKIATGPVTENGFYYDFDCPVSITPDDLDKIEQQMRRIIKANLPIIREEVQREEIRAEINELNEPLKLEILDRIPEGEIITRYFIGSPHTGKPESSLFVADIQPASNYWWDLCAGPHINFTGEIAPDAFKLLNIAGAYWQGDETKAQLQRIYGIAWETKEQLQAYLKQREEALRRDKTDLVTSEKLEEVENLIHDLKNGAKILHTKHGEVALPLILNVGLTPKDEYTANDIEDPHEDEHHHHDNDHDHHHEHHHEHHSHHLENDGFVSISFQSDRPFDVHKFENFLTEEMPQNVFRAKGILWFSDSELRHIFQLSGPRYSLHADEWQTPRKNQAVFIGIKLDINQVYSQLNGCLVGLIKC
jgi:threonyl-tRNA synthetase